MNRGKFIVLEGGEGAGKTTIAKAVASAFPADRLLVTKAGETAFGEELKKMLVSEEGSNVSAEAQFLLAWSAQTDHFQRVVSPALSRGVSVFSDRFDSSIFAYQVTASGATYLSDLFWNVRDEAFKGATPDLYIFLDVPPEVGLARVKKSGRVMDHFEKRSLDFHRTVREGYLEFFKSVPHKIIDATRPLAEVEADVLALIRTHIRTQV